MKTNRHPAGSLAPCVFPPAPRTRAPVPTRACDPGPFTLSTRPARRGSLNAGRVNRWRLLMVTVLMGATVLGSTACQQELTPRTTVDALRILGISASSPELSPGSVTRISALIADPLGGGRSLDWFLTLCTPDDVRGGCLEYNDLLEEYPDESVAQTEYSRCCVRAGSVTPSDGVATIDGPTTWLKLGTSYLDEKSDLEALQGTNAQLNFILCVHGACSSTEGDSSGGLSLPPGQSALAVKRIRVSSVQPDEANDNPGMTGLLVDGLHYGPDEEIPLTAGQVHRLQPELSSNAIECYTVFHTDGTTEPAVESPYFSWYAGGGEFKNYFTEPEPADSCSDQAQIAENLENAVNSWTPPALAAGEEQPMSLTVVMWDRRGGLAWLSMKVRLFGI